MILIHTALLSEAQAMIEKYKLVKINSNPKIYEDEKILVLIGGIGEQNTLRSLEYLFENYSISKALNIGIAGCSNTSIEIGELFCTNHYLKDIEYMTCETVNTPQLLTHNSKLLTLYDMEASYFLETVKQHLDEKNIYVFKVVSDHLDDTILPKDAVKKLIQNSLKQWEKYI